MAPCSGMLSLLLLFSIFFGFSSCFNSEVGFDGFARTQRSLANSSLPCGLINCMKGVCQDSSIFPFYQCQCDQGWQSPLNTSWIPCILPNCSINFGCNGSGNTSLIAPAVDGVFNICALSVCGNGECVTTGNISVPYECKCNPGSTNLFNTPNGYCIEACSLGTDCSNLNVTLGGSSTSPPPPPPTTNQSSSQGTSSSPSPSNQTMPSKGNRPTSMTKFIIFCGLLMLLMGWIP